MRNPLHPILIVLLCALGLVATIACGPIGGLGVGGMLLTLTVGAPDVIGAIEHAENMERSAAVGMASANDAREAAVDRNLTVAAYAAEAAVEGVSGWDELEAVRVGHSTPETAQGFADEAAEALALDQLARTMDTMEEGAREHDERR